MSNDNGRPRNTGERFRIHTPPPPAEPAPQRGSKDKETPTDAIIAIGRQKSVMLFHDLDGQPFARVPLDKQTGRHVTLPMTPRGLGSWLRARYLDGTEKGVSASVIRDALDTLSALAEHRGPALPVYVRLGIRPNGADLVLDLGDGEHRCVQITAQDWHVLGDTTVCMWRPQGMRPLPVPERNGTLDALWDLVNVPESDRVLVAAWLLMTLNPWGPYPALFLHGEQGSAKSTTAELLRSLVDPNKCLLRNPPRDEDALVLAARHGLVVGLDNLSHIDQGLSDILCRLCTGGGLGKRKLYADSEEMLLDFKRPLVVTSIPETATAGDLADRVIALHLPTIPEERRRLDREVRAEFAARHPALLGALLDGMVLALREHKRTVLPGLSRMADFEVWACAGLPALGFDQDDFRAAYRQNKTTSAAAVLDSSPVAGALQMLMDGLTVWEGSPTELLQHLRAKTTDDRDRGWPRSPRGLAAMLRRLAPALRKVCGIEVVFAPRDSHRNRSSLTITRQAGDVGETRAQQAHAPPSSEIPW